MIAQQKIIVYGAGGHAKVVLDLLSREGRFDIIGVVEDDPGLAGKRVLGIEILGDLDSLNGMESDAELLIAIGDNETRKRLASRLDARGYRYVVGRHPSSVVADDVEIGSGTVLMAQTAINPGSRLGRHVIINTGATVDHDCIVGDFVHISPGAHLAGGVTIEPLVHLGTGASVVPNVTIGEGSVIGAGSAVTSDIPPNVTAVGVPARAVRSSE